MELTVGISGEEFVGAELSKVGTGQCLGEILTVLIGDCSLL
jgi:hypothetical protein